MEQLGSHRTDFHEISYLSIFRTSAEKIKFRENLTRITGTLHEELCTFMIISRRILLRMRNVSDKSCRENRNTHFIFHNFAPLSLEMKNKVTTVVFGVLLFVDQKQGP